MNPPLYSIILAAGQGRRMRNRYTHKVCFDIAGVPAIVRAIDTYNRLGVTQNVVVVGELAGQVVETVGRRFSNVVFAYQNEALGTGDAAKCGLGALSGIEKNARLLVVAGDKLIESGSLSRLTEEFEHRESDLCIMSSPAALGGETAGRLLFDAQGRPFAIAEYSDINQRACRLELSEFLRELPDEQITHSQLQTIIARHLGSKASLRNLFGVDFPSQFEADCLDRQDLLRNLEQLPHAFIEEFSGHSVAASTARNSEFRNESIYLLTKDALAYGLSRMTQDNAQGEQYLTDAIGSALTARTDKGFRYQASYVATDHPHEIMSYNNPEELLRIDNHYRGRGAQSLEELNLQLGAERLKTVEQWLEFFPDHDLPLPGSDDALRSNYGDDPELLLDRRRAYRQALLRFRDAFGGNRQAIVVRSPGRINIMGRHIDWQGGRCNLMAVNQEVIMVVSPRSDDFVDIRNVQPDIFPDASLSLGQLVSRLDWDDWLSCVNCQELEHHLRRSNGNWSLYIEAALLRLQMAFRDRLLSGMDIVVNGNIPVAAGMSSSSALVVSTAESAVALHGLDVTPHQFVNFCGEGEWFVGTRGGSADHAAMKFGKKGTINHVTFHDFELLEQIELPTSHRMVVCNSFNQAKKASGAKEAFNSRVASYLVGVELVRLRFPQYAPLVQYVRDISPETLRVPLAKIYELLMELPEWMTAGEIRSLFEDQGETWTSLAPYFENATQETKYPVRGVIWFGISECARARHAADCLKQGDMAALGNLMQVSHDGERCFRVDDNLNSKPFVADISDERLRSLIEDLESGDPRRVEEAACHHQTGAYRCSTEDIDAIVDIACQTPGVEGAQIAGAGLGGCAMVLVQAGAVEDLKQRLIRNFYDPKELPSGAFECTPAAGSCVLSIAAETATVDK